MPARGNESWREVGERGEDEKPLPGEPMRDDEIGGLRRVPRPGGERAIDVDPVATEDEHVEVELARPPALAITSPEGPLELFERHEQGDRAGGRVGSRRHIERGNRVAELGLVDDADRLGRVEPRDAAQSRPGQRGQGAHAGGNRRGRFAEVGPEPDVRPNAPGQGGPPAS